MEKIFLSLLVGFTFFPQAFAGNGDQFFTVNAGFLFQNTLNASFGYERELNYDNAFEIFGEAGDRWERDPECGKVCSKSFWKNYYWNGGVVYKKSIVRWRNSTLRLDVGPVAGAYRGDYFFGAEGSFEYNYTFRGGGKFTLKQKNNVCFMHGDTFRNGLTIGVKIPL
jgi:hypothetical protein